MNTTELIIEYFLDKDVGQVLDAKNILSFNYLENQFFNSIEFIQMIGDLEEKFSITFTDEYLKRKDFSNISGLIKIIEELKKVSATC